MTRGLLSCLVAVGSASGAETMRIAMGDEVRQARLVGDQLAQGMDDDQGDFVALPRREVTVSRAGGALVIDGVPAREGAARFRSQGTIVVNGKSVRGDVVALLGKSGVQFVNVLALEEYLAGVLGSEMPRSFPVEALRAQAVAARTYALHKKLEQYGQPFHLGSGVISQVYGGLEAEDERTLAAAAATRGVVMTYQLQPVEAYFHAACGGRTETGAQALNRDLPYLRAVECPCGKLPQAQWQLEVPEPVSVVARSPTGRATRVQWGGRLLDAVTFRERLGYSKLKSLWFEVVEKRGATQLVGHGFGHGSGMCQWGAKLLAERGLTFREILAHYYPGAELQTLY